MVPAVSHLAALAASLTATDPAIPFISNKDGAVVENGREILDRIVGQIAGPVRWDLCMSSMESSGVTRAIEIAPAGTLVGLLKRGAPHISIFALKSPDDLDNARTFARMKG